MAAFGEREAKLIASSKEAKGHRLLAVLLNVAPYEDELNMQHAIQVDFLYDHLMFCVKKGFPWTQVCAVFKFARWFLEAVAGKNLVEAVRLYQQETVSLQELLPERNFKLYTDFIFSTFFAHFQLYQFVLGNPRQLIAPHKTLVVYPPVHPHPLAKAKELSVWMYECKISELEKKKEEMMFKRGEERERERKEAELLKSGATAKLAAMEIAQTKETLSEMLKSVLADYAAAAAVTISSNITDVQQDLEIMLEIASVPRPAASETPSRSAPKSSTTPSTQLDSKKDSGKGSSGDPQKGSGKGSSSDSKKGSGKGSSSDSKKGSGKGSGHGSKK